MLLQNLVNGQRESDLDGNSWAEEALTYCKKWYPKTTNVKQYKNDFRKRQPKEDNLYYFKINDQYRAIGIHGMIYIQSGRN